MLAISGDDCNMTKKEGEKIKEEKEKSIQKEGGENFFLSYFLERRSELPNLG